MHLLITLHAELPRGKTVGSYIQRFEVDGARHPAIFIKVPRRYRPEILLELPDNTELAMDLGDGSINATGLAGNKTIRIARGELILDGTAALQYRKIRAGFGSGSVIDDRDHTNTGIHNAFSWKEDGAGKYMLTASFGSGRLRFLSAAP